MSSSAEEEVNANSIETFLLLSRIPYGSLRTDIQFRLPEDEGYKQDVC
jgi:hypothetical protein